MRFPGLRALSAATCGISCVLFGLVLLAAGLWPFNFRVQNHARVLPDGRGLEFDAPDKRSKRDLGGLVFSAAPLACRHEGGCAAGMLSMAIELSTDRDARSCVRRIVDVRRADGTEVLFLGQWRSSLIVRAFNTAGGGDKPFREIGMGGVLSPGRTSMVAIVSGSQGTRTYVDGHLVRDAPGIRLLKKDEPLDGHKAYVGNAPDLSCPWAGRVLRLALYGGMWDSSAVSGRPARAPDDRFPCSDRRAPASACYRFDRQAGEWIPDLSGSGNNLRRPHYLVFEKRFLELPNSQSVSTSDVTLNILGFVPLGCLICVWRIRRNPQATWICLLWAAGAGCALSLTIELTQAWLPGRDSSLVDLVTNTAGSIIGGLVVGWRRGTYNGRERITGTR